MPWQTSRLPFSFLVCAQNAPTRVLKPVESGPSACMAVGFNDLAFFAQGPFSLAAAGASGQVCHCLLCTSWTVRSSRCFIVTRVGTGPLNLVNSVPLRFLSGTQGQAPTRGQSFAPCTPSAPSTACSSQGTAEPCWLGRSLARYTLQPCHSPLPSRGAASVTGVTDWGQDTMLVLRRSSCFI